MIKRLLNYIEIQTKITSLFAFALTVAILLFHDVRLNLFATGVFFLGMFLFDLTTTATNNYIDSKTNGQSIGFQRKTGLAILMILLFLSVAAGLYLVYLTDWVILILGAFSFAVGISYTYGPVPISRQPYGEVISGILYGMVIPFILVYINTPELMLELSWQRPWLDVSLNLSVFLGFVLIALVPTLLTATIMLGNNICDVEADIKVKRYTLPYYLGQKHSLRLLWACYVIVYLAILMAVVLRLIPIAAIVTLATSIRVYGNVKRFSKDLIKRISFVYIIRNFVLIMTVLTLTVLLGGIL